MTTTIDTPTLPSSVRPRRRLRVLLVDDARAERELYCTHLRGAGYDVQVATDGMEAIACAVVRRPDAIVIDVGAARLEPLRAVERARAAGCAACLAGPFTPEDLRAELDRQLGQYRPRPRRRGRAGRS